MSGAQGTRRPMGIVSWLSRSRAGSSQASGGRRLSEPTPLFATSGGTTTTDQRTCTSSNAGHPAAVGAVGWSVARPQGQRGRGYICGPRKATWRLGRQAVSSTGSAPIRRVRQIVTERSASTPPRSGLVQRLLFDTPCCLQSLGRCVRQDRRWVSPELPPDQTVELGSAGHTRKGPSQKTN